MLFIVSYLYKILNNYFKLQKARRLLPRRLTITLIVGNYVYYIFQPRPQLRGGVPSRIKYDNSNHTLNTRGYLLVAIYYKYVLLLHISSSRGLSFAEVSRGSLYLGRRLCFLFIVVLLILLYFCLFRPLSIALQREGPVRSPGSAAPAGPCYTVYCLCIVYCVVVLFYVCLQDLVAH